MKMENIISAFPEMPEEMRRMVEWEVTRQMKIERPIVQRRTGSNIGNFSRKKLMLIVLASTMLLGLTAAAGARIYQMYSKKEGNYGAKTGAVASGTVSDMIPEMKICVRDVPEGMYECTDLCGEGKYHYKNEVIPHTTGITLVSIMMDTEGNLDEMADVNVVERTELDVKGHEAVLLKKQVIRAEGINYRRVMYVMYPEVQHILQMFASPEVSEDEMIKMAETIELVPTGKMIDGTNVYTWNDQVKQQDDVIILERKVTASIEEMEKLHAMNEMIPISVHSRNADGKMGFAGGVQVKVTDVQVSDDLSLLENEEYVDPRWKNAVDSNGKLESNIIQYVKAGDGIETLDEIVKTEETAQKLVYVTLEYTNTRDNELKDVLFNHAMIALEEWNGGYAHCEWVQQEKDKNWNYIVNTSVCSLGEMGYYDIHSGERNNNYISKIAPGETVTLHIANIVQEKQLPYLYLDVTGTSGYEFTQDGLRTGYVDIRQ